METFDLTPDPKVLIALTPESSAGIFANLYKPAFFLIRQAFWAFLIMHIYAGFSCLGHLCGTKMAPALRF